MNNSNNSNNSNNPKVKQKRQSFYNKRPATSQQQQASRFVTKIGYTSMNKATTSNSDNTNSVQNKHNQFQNNNRTDQNSAFNKQSNRPGYNSDIRKRRDNAQPGKVNNKRNQGGRRYSSNYFAAKSSYKYELILVKRIVKVVKGGRRFRFSVVVVIGDYKNKIGYGIGKANEIPIAILKARSNAEKKLITVNINSRTESIWFNVSAKYNASKIILKNARPGVGIVAGGSTRQLLSFSGIKNIYAKAHGSRNKINMILATIKALEKNQPKGWIRQDYSNDIH